MYTQNTPVHIKLWHRDFWLMALANLLVTMAVYSQISLLPDWMLGEAGFSHRAVAVVMGLQGVGVFVLGCFCSYLVQRYRRNKVCVLAILGVAACIFTLLYIKREWLGIENGVALVAIVRFVQGATFGLAQMVLSSTLIIDTCESFQRTEANHSATWFSRFALALGPALALTVAPFYGFDVMLIASALLCVLAVAFILMVKFPFKAPEETIHKVSLDRFFLPQGKWLFINLLLTTTVVGIILSDTNTLTFYGMMTVGFLLSLLAQRFVFVNAELKSEATSGLILMAVAVLMRMSARVEAAEFLSPVLLGCGVGVIGARFLLFFLKLRGHCQRGTSQSTFFLSWEAGLSLGLFLGYYFFYGDGRLLNVAALVLLCLSLIMYVFFTHSWYMKNKNR